jgi:DNA-directed RNA polymerase specialized sigma24 family protein
MSSFAIALTLDVLAVLERERPASPEPHRTAITADAFEAIYCAPYRDAIRYIRLSLRQRDDADDVVADTFDRAFAAFRLT